MNVSLHEMPATLSEALYLAATLAKENEELKRQLAELMSNQYPEVLRPAHIAKLLGVGLSTVNEWVREWEKDPENSPLLNRDRRKGEKVLVLKSDLYRWLILLILFLLILFSGDPPGRRR